MEHCGFPPPPYHSLCLLQPGAYVHFSSSTLCWTITLFPSLGPAKGLHCWYMDSCFKWPAQEVDHKTFSYFSPSVGPFRSFWLMSGRSDLICKHGRFLSSFCILATSHYISVDDVFIKPPPMTLSSTWTRRTGHHWNQVQWPLVHCWNLLNWGVDIVSHWWLMAQHLTSKEMFSCFRIAVRTNQKWPGWWIHPPLCSRASSPATLLPWNLFSAGVPSRLMAQSNLPRKLVLLTNKDVEREWKSREDVHHPSFLGNSLKPR